MYVWYKVASSLILILDGLIEILSYYDFVPVHVTIRLLWRKINWRWKWNWNQIRRNNEHDPSLWTNYSTKVLHLKEELSNSFII